MNKPKKTDPKKILVRNTQRPVPKTRLIIDGKEENKEKTKSQASAAKPKDYGPKFQSPQPNSVLQIAKKIDKLEKVKPQKVKGAPDIAFSERMTRKVNFPSDQAIYKDLIPLQVPVKSAPILTSRQPLPQKDKEPILSEFAQPNKTREFIYEPCTKYDNPSILTNLNNLRLYKILQTHQQ